MAEGTPSSPPVSRFAKLVAVAKLAAAEDPRRKKPDEAAEEVEPDDPDNEGEDQAEEQEAEGGDGDESASEDEGQDFDEEETKQASRKREKNLPRHKLALKPQRSNAHDDDDADGEIGHPRFANGGHALLSVHDPSWLLIIRECRVTRDNQHPYPTVIR